MAEISRATKAFVAGNLHVYAVPDVSADTIHLQRGETTRLPIMDVWLQSVEENDAVSHSGTMKGVTGSLFIPGTDILAKSNNQAERKIRLDSGPARGSEFGTIYVDPDLDTMDGWAEGGEERRLMLYWAGKVVLPPDLPATELSTLTSPSETSE